MPGGDNTIEIKYAVRTENQLPTSFCSEIPKLQQVIDYGSFFQEFLRKNLPCIVKIPSLSAWKSAKEWVSSGKPNFDVLHCRYSNASVPVADCGEKYYNVQRKSTALFGDYLKYWKEYIDRDYSTNMPCLYLKDWHFTRDYPNESIYRVPHYFASDWLNEYLTSRTDVIDDYRFVYMGPKGSWTPLHVDVFTSFSWSVNVTGRKRWLLFPPGQEEYLRDKYGSLAYDATSSGLLNNDLTCACDVIQETGEAIFVPSGWHHQVWNLEDTISINHNWVNGCNIINMLAAMKKTLISVKKEIEDCRSMEDWEEHCQVMLKSLFGMNYEEFYKFLLFIASRRIDSLNTSTPLVLYGDWKLGKGHCIFDLEQLKEVLGEILSDPDILGLKSFETMTKPPRQLYERIDTVLERES